MPCENLLNNMNPFFLFALLLLSGFSAYVLRTERQVRGTSLFFTALVAGLTLVTAYHGLLLPLSFGPDEMWHVDAPAALLLALAALLFTLAGVVSYRYISAEHKRGILSLSDVRLYYLLFPTFFLTLLAAIMANSIIVLWIAMEGTTLVTAFLVALYRRKSSLEAAWKYVLLCSIGIGLSLTGLVLMAFAFKTAGLVGNAPFLITILTTTAGSPMVNSALVKLAFVFLMVGFSTKIGLVPVHTWLPDALSKTPSPVGALFSGILLPVGLVTLLRFKLIVDIVLQSTHWTDVFFLVFGLMSILLPACLLAVQHNYKRVLAYATIVHMGLMVFAIGLGPSVITPVFMHLPVFSLLLSAGFFLSGEVILHAHSTNIEILKGLAKKMPITSALLFFVLIMTLALPPGGLFISQLLILAKGLGEHVVMTLIALAGMMLFFGAIMRIAFVMFFAEDEAEDISPKEHRTTLTHAVAVLEIGVAIFLGAAYLLPQTLRFFETLTHPLTVGL